ncbi:MAG: hypothetical protein HYU78_13915 [Rhodocyclales bacterium]|nr:hypothetical protein [Rhodocyclales bacterium]
MDPINSLNKLTEILRKRVAAEAAEKRKGAANSREAATTASARRADTEALREQIACSIRAIDPDDPARVGKTVRVFVESVLSWQFGAGLLSDPGFADLVNDVQSALESDPEFFAALERAMSETVERKER